MWRAFEIKRHVVGNVQTCLGESLEEFVRPSSREGVWVDYLGNTCEVTKRPIDLNYDWQSLVNAYTEDWIRDLNDFHRWLAEEVQLPLEQIELAVKRAANASMKEL